MKINIPTKKYDGFTIVELLVVVVILVILSVLVHGTIGNTRDRAWKARADTEMLAMSNAFKLYVNKNNTYPPDVDRNVPAEIKENLSVDNDSDDWPNAPWPGSVYDFDAWDIDGDLVNETYQISVRFCPKTGPSDLSDCIIPNESFASGFRRKSAYYYCFKGYCRSHVERLVTYPGYCVNCPDNQAIKMPTE